MKWFSQFVTLFNKEQGTLIISVNILKLFLNIVFLQNMYEKLLS